jgi:predicted DNA-binding transcriptional regulator YafY
MARSSDPERAARLNAALALMQEHESLSQAAAVLVGRFGISKRQAYRYLDQARARDGPVPIPDRKVAFTVKLSEGLVEALRQHARVRGKRLSEIVAEALGAFLRRGRGRG